MTNHTKELTDISFNKLKLHDQCLEFSSDIDNWIAILTFRVPEEQKREWAAVKSQLQSANNRLKTFTNNTKVTPYIGVDKF